MRWLSLTADMWHYWVCSTCQQPLIVLIISCCYRDLSNTAACRVAFYDGWRRTSQVVHRRSCTMARHQRHSEFSTVYSEDPYSGRCCFICTQPVWAASFQCMASIWNEWKWMNEWMNEWKCDDFKCVWKPTESRLCLTHYVNKSSRWAK